jgi:MFS family permease
MATTDTGPSRAPAKAVSPTLPYTLALSVVFLIVLCLGYATNAADRQVFPTLLPEIRKAFGYDLKIAGLLSTVFTLGLAIAGFPTGFILDRTSRKSVILIGMVIYSVFTLATIFAHGFWDMLVYRALTGVGEGMQMAGLFAAIGSYFHRKRSFYIGWMVVAYGAGGFFGPRIGAALAQEADNWRVPFIWFAVVGFVMAVVVLLIIPIGFSESKGPAATDTVDKVAFAHIPANLWNRNVILGFVGCIILGYTLFGFIGLYTTYLRDVLEYAPMAAATAFSYFGLGGLLSFVGGWCGDRFPQRGVIGVAFALMAAIGYSMYNVANSFRAQSLLCFLTGVFASGFVFVNLLSLLQRSVRPQMVGRASGIFLTSLFGSASTAGYQMGALVGKFGWGNAALIELTLFPVIGIIAMLLINPSQLIAVRKSA